MYSSNIVSRSIVSETFVLADIYFGHTPAGVNRLEYSQVRQPRLDTAERSKLTIASPVKTIIDYT